MAEEPFSLLVVEDGASNREAMRRILDAQGYEVTTAEDGERALSLIAGRAFDLVLLDVSMPGLDGFQVLRTLRERHSALDLPVIMATAHDVSEDVVRALELGASDYVTKPFDVAVLLARVRTHLSLKRSVRQVMALEEHLTRRNAELEVANARLQVAHDRRKRDLEAAARIQEAFLPRGTPDVAGVRFAWAFRPCEELAGDCLNVFRLDADHLGLYVLDVSGHGVAAALLSVAAAHALSPTGGPNSILVREGDGRPVSPAKVAELLNERFPWDDAKGQFFTLLYATFNVKTGELCYVSAGHPGAVLLGSGAAPATLKGRGLPIGLGAGYEESSVRLRPGDRVYLYSDGVTEAADPGGVPFGLGRLETALERGRPAPLQESVSLLLDAVRRWRGDSPLQDDVSVLALEVV